MKRIIIIMTGLLSVIYGLSLYLTPVSHLVNESGGPRNGAGILYTLMGDCRIVSPSLIIGGVLLLLGVFFANKWLLGIGSFLVVFAWFVVAIAYGTWYVFAWLGYSGYFPISSNVWLALYVVILFMITTLKGDIFSYEYRKHS
jgi:hypothetical protein